MITENSTDAEIAEEAASMYGSDDIDVLAESNGGIPEVIRTEDGAWVKTWVHVFYDCTPVSVRVLIQHYTVDEDEDGNCTGDVTTTHEDMHFMEFESGQELRAHLRGEGVIYASCSPLPSDCRYVWVESEPEPLSFETNELKRITYSIPPDANEDTLAAWEYALSGLEGRQ